ncbi:hypothetical protein CEUSTIGMA_g5314.t1 [Chlamydomonas eustigma]|uniref:TOG domain-containing protein n=1 Tax=Chlamydomonas eustigma TaxID=1157962 RepID=A0A250X4Q8_9CHLO|nr:hypothetical protein CEUSTIGMA_g5314.t1 [Chlamydomonas eustigma]|eukprot:GAX77872.1 hypothetical protein CEUSTIGMA_g5314.t1 [Chlamydomonas eustigma]
MSDDEVKLLADAKILPMTERVAHSNWKVRNSAYEDIKLACQRVFSDSDPCLVEYGGLFTKAVGDSNAAAQDRALECLLVYLSKAADSHAVKMAEKTSNAIVNKALNGRTSAVLKATDVLLAFIELEQGDKVIESLINSGLSHKIPKVVITVLDIIALAYSLFGTKTIPPQPILKALPALFDSKDGKAREKVKDLVVELSRWTGMEVIRGSLFPKMRDAMKEDIEKAVAAMGELGVPKPCPERFTRKEQAKRAETSTAVPMDVDDSSNPAGSLGKQDEEEVAPEVDPFDISEPKDILPQLKKDFWEGLESKKWNDRKAQLTLLKDLASYPHLASGRDYDYGDVNRELRKLITKDANIQCVSEAIACCGALAKSIRAGYSSTAKGLVEILVEKFKEKNASIGRAASDALASMHRYCWTLLDVSDSLAGGLCHSNPKVKEDVLTWLTAEISSEAKGGISKLGPLLIPPAVKCAEEAAPSLREAAVGFLVAFALKAGSPAALDKYTSKLDDVRKKAIEQKLAEAAGTKPTIQPKMSSAAAPSSPSTLRPTSSAASSGGAALPFGSRMTASSLVAQAKASSRGNNSGTKAGASASAMASNKSSMAPSTGSGHKAGASSNNDAEDEASLSAGSLSKDNLNFKMNLNFGDATVKELGSEDWKVRLSAMERIVSYSEDPEKAHSECSVLAQGMGYVPGWGEKNFQVMLKQFEVIRNVATLSQSFSKHDAFVGVTGAIEKLSDMKLKGPACDTLLSICEAVGPQFVAILLHKKAAAHKNPKILSECLMLIGQIIEDFGISQLPVKNLLEWAKEDLGSANAGVRNAVIQMLGVMHRFLGPPLGDMIRPDVKPALMTAIDNEFSKNPKRDAGQYAPARKSRGSAGTTASSSGNKPGSSSGGSCSASGGSGAMAMEEDLLPRQDISSSITSTLTSNMGSANWKDRKAAMDEVESLLKSAGNRIQSKLGDLVSALKPRLADSNKNLTAQALQLLAKLAGAMGKPIDKAARSLLEPALKNISDQKAQVRAAVLDVLDAWSAACGSDGLISELLDCMGAKCSSEGRAEGMSWLATCAADAGRVSSSHIPDFLKALALGSSDKASEVRTSASLLASALASRFSPAELTAALSSLDQDHRKTANEALSKVLGATSLAAPLQGSPVMTSRSSAPGLAASTNSLRSSVSRPASAAQAGSLAGGLAGSNVSLRSSVNLRSSISMNKTSTSSKMDLLAAQENSGPLLLLDNKKEDRAKKGKFRPTKFEVRPEEGTVLEGELSALLSPALKGLMFNKAGDFKKHCEAAGILVEALPGIFNEVMSCLDLILRWCVLRIVESNTQSLMKTLELLKAILEAMAQAGARLTEFEAKLLLPALVEKSGHNQDKVRAEHRELMRKAAAVYGSTKIVLFIKDGMDSKNNKTKVVCVEEIGSMIDAEGPILYRLNRQVDILGCVARLVTERDNALRQAVLGTMEAVYCCEGDGMWKWLGKLTDQQRSLIEERLKYTDKELAKQGLQPGFRAAMMASAGETSMDWEPVSASKAAAALSVSGSSPLASARIQAGSPPPLSAAGNGSEKRPSSPGLRRSLQGSLPAGPGGSTSSRRVSPGGVSTGAAAAGGSILGNVRSSMPVAPTAAAAVHSNSQADNSVPAGQLSMARLPAQSAATNMTTLQSLNPVLGLSSNGRLSTGGLNSPMQQLRHDSDGNAREDFDGCMKQLQRSALDDEQTIQVMKLLCYEFQDMHPTVFNLFKQNINPLVELLCDRMDEIFGHAGQAVVIGQQHNNRACKYVLNFMANIFNMAPLASSTGEKALRKTMSTVLCCLVDDRIVAAPEGVALLRALNLLMMKTLENSNRTYVFSALIPLLLHPHERIHTLDPKYESMWYELVVKCTIKVTKALQQAIESVDLAALLLYIHDFFDELGPEELRKRGAREDKPVRMVKTILHELCKAKGRDIYNYTSHIPGAHLDPANRPHIFPYIDLNLSTMGVPPQAQHPAPAAPASNSSLMQSQGMPSHQPSRSTVPEQGSVKIMSTNAGDTLIMTKMPLATVDTNTSHLPSAGSRAPAGIIPNDVAKSQQHPLTTTTAATTNTSVVSSTTAVSSVASHNSLTIGAVSTVTSAHSGVVLAPSSDVFSTKAPDESAARNTLATIFKRIAEKDTQALVDLYYFKEVNPDQDIEAMLSSASATFKNFILRGLYKVKLQAANQKAAAAQGSASISATSHLTSSFRYSTSAAGSQPATSDGGSCVSADGEAVVNTIPAAAAGGASLFATKQLMVASYEAASTTSPSSPSQQRLHQLPGVTNNRVGGENIAALRERMSQIQFAYNAQQPANRRAAAMVTNVSTQVTKDAQIAVCDEKEAPQGVLGSVSGGVLQSSTSFSKVPAVSPSLVDEPPAGTVSNLEALQRRIRDLSVK